MRHNWLCGGGKLTLATGCGAAAAAAVSPAGSAPATARSIWPPRADNLAWVVAQQQVYAHLRARACVRSLAYIIPFCTIYRSPADTFTLWSLPGAHCARQHKLATPFPQPPLSSPRPSDQLGCRLSLRRLHVLPLLDHLLKGFLRGPGSGQGACARARGRVRGCRARVDHFMGVREPLGGGVGLAQACARSRAQFKVHYEGRGGESQMSTE